MTGLEAQVAEWADGEENVRAVALVGSRARVDVPADEWSDYDIVIFARDPAALLVRDDWVGTFGRARLTFLEPTAVGDQLERRVLYEDGTDVDFAIVPVERLDHPAVAHVAARGIRVLVDKDGALGARLADLPEPEPVLPPNEASLRELTADFFYHAVWAARKLKRGEVFTAKRCVDSYMENVLLRVMEWRARAADPSIDTWHAGRFVERWAEPATLEEFGRTFAAYDEADVRRALFASMDFFRRQARETADLLGLVYPAEEDEFATVLVHDLLDRRA
jgi:aminoglycoside 6-adenylyltransferase